MIPAAPIPSAKGPYAARDANVEVFCTERGGDTYAGPAEQSAYLDPAWGESFRYFAHQPARGACEDAD